MRIVFIGSVYFSYECLKTVIELGGNVVGIITTKAAGFNSDYIDLLPVAEERNIPIYRCDNVMEEGSVNFIKNLQPDIIFCFGFSQIIGKQILELPRMGVIGYHPAELPKNRGRHPLIWALVLGLKKTASTFFKMNEKADAGDILSQKDVFINEDDNAETLYRKIIDIAKVQISEFLPKLQKNEAIFLPQDHTKATYWRKRGEKDGIIDWRMSINAILNLVRALYKPYMGAEFIYKDKKYKLWKAEKYNLNLTDIEFAEPGKVVKIVDGRPVIKCYDGLILLKEIEPPIDIREGEYL